MKKLILPLLAVIFFLSQDIYAQNQDSSFLKFCVYALADDSMGGRKPGTKPEMKAGDFIALQFKNLKIKSFFKKNYFQQFAYNYDSCSYNTRNVIAHINNQAKENIVIGAHYDHIGFGGKRSRSYGKYEVHNGADDNASGVSMMLLLAKHLKKRGPKNYNYIFVAFSGHEDGLFGSSYFVSSNLVDSHSVKLMINLDMVGRADKDTPTLLVASNDSMYQSKDKAIAENAIIVKSKELPTGDHTAFSNVHIPVVLFTTGTHDDYHKITDDAVHINYKGMIYIENYISNFLIMLGQIK